MLDKSKFRIRTLSTHESMVVLSLTEQKRREIARPEIIEILGVSQKAADHTIHSLRQKGWLERASWGKYLLINPDQGPEALGEGNLFALASCITDPYYLGYSTAAAHYGFTTQHRNVIWLVTPHHLRDRTIADTEVRIVNVVERKFFGFHSIDVLGDPIFISDFEKTVIDCVDRPELAGGVGEVAYIVATASQLLNWTKVVDYLERIGSTPLIRRFGWFVDHVQADIIESERDRLLKLVGHERKTYLGPQKPIKQAIGYNKTWRLFVNVTKEELHGTAGLGHRRKVKKGD